jgi:transposase InsO family protein
MAKFPISINRLKPGTEHWRDLANYWHLSAGGRQRLEWIIFYHSVAKKNASETAAYFGISRKTLHKWLKRFNPQKIQSLEEISRRPHRVRQWTVTQTEEQRVITLRMKHLCYGKEKLQILYRKQYRAEISTWKIERVIEKHHLYPDPKEHQRVMKLKKRRKHQARIRINTLDTQTYPPGTLWHIDSIIVWWYDAYRVMITALEDKTKLGFARVYLTHSSRNAADFLKRLIYLSAGDIAIIHSDNGSEFQGNFAKAIKESHLTQVYSRIKWPKDNPCLERFNRTLQDEWLALSEIGLDEVKEANQDLTNWLIEYNFNRPHETLDYLTPIEYAHTNYFQVLPMYPASTLS